MGLLGIAPDPNFDANGFVYLYRTKPAAGGCGSSTGRFNQVVRVTMSGDTVVAGSLTELLTGIRTDGGNHDGGTLRIGPDDKLWVSVGDTGIGDGGAPGPVDEPVLAGPRARSRARSCGSSWTAARRRATRSSASRPRGPRSTRAASATRSG